MLKFYLVRAVLARPGTTTKTKHRIVMAVDPIGAAQRCYDALPPGSLVPGKKYPDHFLVHEPLSGERFNEEVGAITVTDDLEDAETPLDTVIEMFNADPLKVRL